ncbi:unnamed protein product [Lampetra planeri]
MVVVLLTMVAMVVVVAGQLAVGTCEVVTLSHEEVESRRAVSTQTARCACRRGQVAGTTLGQPACVDAHVVRVRAWCEMRPCVAGEQCRPLRGRAGWTCSRPGGRLKTTTPPSTSFPWRPERRSREDEGSSGDDDDDDDDDDDEDPEEDGGGWWWRMLVRCHRQRHGRATQNPPRLLPRR